MREMFSKHQKTLLTKISLSMLLSVSDEINVKMLNLVLLLLYEIPGHG